MLKKLTALSLAVLSASVISAPKAYVLTGKDPVIKLVNIKDPSKVIIQRFPSSEAFFSLSQHAKAHVEIKEDRKATVTFTENPDELIIKASPETKIVFVDGRKKMTVLHGKASKEALDPTAIKTAIKKDEPLEEYISRIQQQGAEQYEKEQRQVAEQREKIRREKRAARRRRALAVQARNDQKIAAALALQQGFSEAAPAQPLTVTVTREQAGPSDRCVKCVIS